MSATKQVVRLGPFKELIPSGVRSGDLITLSGQVAVDAAGEVVGKGDLAAQLRQAYANVREVMEAFGAPVSSIVDEMWLVTDVGDAMARLEELFAIRAEMFGNPVDVSQTLVQVSALVMPELLVEVKCVAKL